MLKHVQRWWWNVLLGLMIIWAGSARPATYAAISDATSLPVNVELLAVYVLAYDNNPTSPNNLTPHYQPTLSSLVAASVGHPEKLAVVLADLDGMGDTHIRVVYDGLVTSIPGLPDENGTLDLSRTEYDVTDGTTLAGFLRWVRQRFQSEHSILAYIGHGTPLVPETDFSAIWGTNPRPEAISSLPPLPTNIGANPDLTDHHTPLGSSLRYGVLTPFAFAQALQGSQQLFDVIDVVMCFGASIEEFYEIAPHTNVIIGSPNYAFFDPTSPGQVLSTLNPSMSALEMGKTMVDTYHALLPPSDHPRILAAVETVRLSLVKNTWDELSEAVYQLLVDPPTRADTRTKLRQAYGASIKYDLTHCAPNDWELREPDGLVDLRHLAVQLQLQFAGTPVADLALAAENALFDEAVNQGAVYHHVATNAVPWFAPTVSPWIFTGTNNTTIDDDALGLSIYADLMGRPLDGNTELSWHAHWYHDDALAADNLHPYQFINDTVTAHGWDEVIQAFWDGTPTQTVACMAPYPVARDLEPITDLAMQRLPQPSRRIIPSGQPIVFGADISSSAAIRSFLVQFTVLQNGTTVYSNTVHTGPLVRGSHFIQAAQSWTPTQLGSYIVLVDVDPDNRIIEFNESNNRRRFVGEIVQHEQLPKLIGQVQDTKQLIATPQIQLVLNQVQGLNNSVDRLVVQFYQFEYDAQTGMAQPIERGRIFSTVQLPNIALPLPPSIQPGALVLHVWGLSAAGRTLEPLVLQLNYAPAAALINIDASHIYRFQLMRGDRVEFGVQVPQGDNVDLLLWEPFITNQASQISQLPGADLISLDPALLSGWYTLVVNGDATEINRYTLTALRNNTPIRQSQASQPSIIKSQRPQFREPLIEDIWHVFIPLVRR